MIPTSSSVALGQKIPLSLTIRRESADDIVLPLLDAPPPLTEEGIERDAPAVLSTERCTFLLCGIRSERATATLFLEGEVLRSDLSFLTKENETRIAFFPEDEAPFGSIIGIARLSVLISVSGNQINERNKRKEWFLPPVQVLLPEGRAADNIRAMSEIVSRSAGVLFPGEAVEQNSENSDEKIQEAENEENEENAVKAVKALESRIRLLGVIERIYEDQYPYFRDGARYRLKPDYRVRSLEAMRGFTPEAARWIASHPDELVEVRRGNGIKIRAGLGQGHGLPGGSARSRYWLPSHLPTRTTQASFDIVENRAVVGFITTVGREAVRFARVLSEMGLNSGTEKKEKAKAAATAASAVASPTTNTTTTPTAWGANELMRRGSSKRIEERIEELSRQLNEYGIALSRISNLYRDALGFEVGGKAEGRAEGKSGADSGVVNRLPAATPHFLQTAPYRLIYGVMREWFNLPPVDPSELKQNLKKIVERMVSVKSSRLYEYFVLVKLLSAIKESGFTLVSSTKHTYAAASASRSFNSNDASNSLNTFRFERRSAAATAAAGDSGDEPLTNPTINPTTQTEPARLTLWYQPYISSGAVETAGITGSTGSTGIAGENGIGLCRATSLGFESSADGMTSALKESSIDFYTPDYLISVEENGVRRWFVIDAKYSKLSSVRRHQTAALVFKYLVSLKPLTKKDRLCGLLLFCGSIEPDAAPEGSIFDRLPPGAVGEPDLRLFRLTALDQSGLERSRAAHVERILQTLLGTET